MLITIIVNYINYINASGVKLSTHFVIGSIVKLNSQKVHNPVIVSAYVVSKNAAAQKSIS
jgi:hypothetical protein